MTTYKVSDWLPTTKKEVEICGYNSLDVILFTGDAYVDHPSFGIAVIGRVLQNLGLKVAIVSQPNWQDDLRDFQKLGKPNLFFGVTAGNMDSMINHYTANLRKRSDDAYTVGGKSGFRPDRAATVYSNILKKIYPDVPIILGGIEASLRRLTHYDYWSNSVMPSLLVDSKADMIIYGMAEKAITELVESLRNGMKISELHTIPQTVFLTPNYKQINSLEEWQTVELHSHELCKKDKKKFAENFSIIETESNKWFTKRIMEKNGDKFVIVNPPYPPINEQDMDTIYDLPFTRLPHPKYEGKEPIPAYEMIRHSVTMHRGCFGGCSFCTISAHQGKFVSNRTEKSILKEVDQITKMTDFKGHISDLGGPSANMYKMQGKNLEICKKCSRYSCIHPQICKNLETSHLPLLEVYRKVRSNDKIKKATIGSGVRYDLIFSKNGELSSESRQYLTELLQYHVSGRLKVAPEHTEEEVLKLMRKPSFSYFMKMKMVFDSINEKLALNQQLIPYFISSHPGCGEMQMAELAIKTKSLHFKLEQVQDFTPTPMTLSSVMYYAGFDPDSGKKLFSAHSQEDKVKQRQYFFWHKQEVRNQLIRELEKRGRKDLVDKLFFKK